MPSICQEVGFSISSFANRAVSVSWIQRQGGRGQGRLPWWPDPGLLSYYVYYVYPPVRIVSAPSGLLFFVRMRCEEPAEVTGHFAGGGGTSVTIKPQLVA